MPGNSQVSSEHVPKPSWIEESWFEVTTEDCIHSNLPEGGHEDSISRVLLQTSSTPTTTTSQRQSEQSPNEAEANAHKNYSEQKETNVALLFGRRFHMVSGHGQIKLSSSHIG